MIPAIIILSILFILSFIANVYFWLYANFRCYCLDYFDYNILWQVAYAFVILAIIGIIYDLYRWRFFRASLLLPLVVLNFASLTYLTFLLYLKYKQSAWIDIVLDNPIIRIERVWESYELVSYIIERFEANPYLKNNTYLLFSCIQNMNDLGIRRISTLNDMIYLYELEAVTPYRRPVFEPMTMYVLFDGWPKTHRYYRN